jgi:gmma-aminobutyric acid receptor subunit gamma/cGMP-dependent protein kinase 2
MSLSDFRPISVTPLLSRLTEKLVVRDWLRPAFVADELLDQYAFKPTGSTECALINCMDFITRNLDSNDYVRCLFIDFTKAFDVVHHATVIKKLHALNMPAFIKNWIISFLSGRSQITRINNSFSSELAINCGIVQGSGIGPSMYVLMESDLHSLSGQNIIVKYADDTNLLVPQHSDISMVEEFNNVLNWAQKNTMIINYSKTKEMVFHRPHPTKFSVLPSFTDIEITHEARLLGIVLSDGLSFERHVAAVLACCSQRFYLLKLLRDGGMTGDNLDVVFVSLIINRLTYCLSAWGGFLNGEQVGRINAVLRRAKRYCLTDYLYDAVGLLDAVDNRLFCSMQNEWHCLHHLLPPKKDDYWTLRPRGHTFVLPRCRSELYRQSFLPRVLYKNL